MKKILYIEATSSKGGIETFILNTCKYLDRNAYKVTVLANCRECSIERELKEAGVKIRHIRPAEKGIFAYYKDLNRIIRPENFDIVHINKNSLAEPLALLISKKNKIRKIILHSHNTHPTSGKISSVLHKIFRNLLISPKIWQVACSEQAAEWMFPKRKSCLLLKNGIETEKYAFCPEIREKVRDMLGLSPNQSAICNVGRLCPQKNTLFLLEIMHRIVRKQPNAKLFLIGTGELETSAKEKTKALKLEKNVVFMGKRTDVNELLQGMDLFLMPSLHEGLPIAAVEAQAASLPLLISDTVDKDVKILDSTEFQELNSSPEIWAEHCLKLIEKSQRSDTGTILKKAGYDIRESVKELVKLYKK